MPRKSDLSIVITNTQGKFVVWTLSDPLPPESRFLPLHTTVGSNPLRTSKPKRSTVFLRIKMFIKTKVKKMQGTRVVSTGHNHGATDPSKNPTIMHRFKNLLTHASKPDINLSSHVTAHDGRPAPRGRQASWTSMCRGCRAHGASAIPHDLAVCHFQEQDRPSDAIPFSSPRRGAISHTLNYGVSSRRFQTATETTENLLSRSIVRSPSTTPIFKDDTRVCGNQQDGNVGMSGDYFTNIRTSSFGSDGSEVNVSIDGVYHHPFELERRQNSSQMTVSDEQSTFRLDYLESEGVSPFTTIGEPTRSLEDVQPQTSRANSSRGHLTFTEITPKNTIDEPPSFFLGLPPSFRPLTPNPTPSDLLINIEEAINSNIAKSNITPTQQPRPVSSIYSSTHSSELFVSHQHDYPHEPADPIQAYMETEWPNPPHLPPFSPVVQDPSFSIERGLEPSNDQLPPLPFSKTQSRVSIPRLCPQNRSFSIERGYLEESARETSSSRTPTPTPTREIPILASNIDTSEPEIMDVSISSFGSSFMEILPQRPAPISPRSSEEFEMVSSVEKLPAESSDAIGRKMRSKGPAVPGRWPSVSSSMYSGREVG